MAFIAVPFCIFVTNNFFFTLVSTSGVRNGMSVPTDISLMDFLFEREDPILNLTDKDSVSRNDEKDTDAMTVS